jgi:hypothetical protein
MGAFTGGSYSDICPPCPKILEKKSNSESKKICILSIPKKLKILSRVSDYKRSWD